MVIDVRSLTSSIVIKQQVADFLENKSFNTAKEKISVLAALYEAERSEEYPLVISEDEYNDVLKAVMSGKYVVDTGIYYVNAGEPINREEFLTQTGVSVDDNGKSSVNFDLDLFHNAKPFTLHELETVLHPAYRTSSYILLENEAIKKYGKES